MPQKLAEAGNITGSGRVSGDYPQHIANGNIIDAIMQHHDWLRAEQAPGIKFRVKFAVCQKFLPPGLVIFINQC